MPGRPTRSPTIYNLVEIGYYDGDPLFRVIQGFMVQFGINPATPAVNAKWQPRRSPTIPHRSIEHPRDGHICHLRA